MHTYLHIILYIVIYRRPNGEMRLYGKKRSSLRWGGPFVIYDFYKLPIFYDWIFLDLLHQIYVSTKRSEIFSQTKYTSICLPEIMCGTVGNSLKINLFK